MSRSIELHSTFKTFISNNDKSPLDIVREFAQLTKADKIFTTTKYNCYFIVYGDNSWISLADRSFTMSGGYFTVYRDYLTVNFQDIICFQCAWHGPRFKPCENHKEYF